MIDIVLRLMAINVSLPCVPDPVTGISPCDDGNLIGSILMWAYITIGVVAVIIFIYAGIVYMTSEGEPEKVKEAERIINYTIIGLIVATAAAAMVGFVTGAFR